MGIFAPFGYRRILAGEPGVIYDVDAQAFFTATGITNTGLKGAVNDFVVGLKDNGIWNSMDIIYPFVGDDVNNLATQFAFNLKNVAQYNPTLVNGVANSNLNGYQSVSASTRYINTNYIPRTVRGTTGPIHVSIYTTNTGMNGGRIDWGGFVNNAAYSYMVTGRSLSGGNTEKLGALRPDSFAGVTNTAANGYYLAKYDSGDTTRSRLYRNGTQIASSTAVGTNGLGTNSAFFGAWNSNGTPQFITDKQYQLLTVGSNLTSTQITNLNTLVQNFQTAVDTALGTSRKV